MLRTWKLGEADRIISLLTRHNGKVRAVAKGARKTKSKVGGRVEPYSHLELLLWQGKDLHTLAQAETKASNANLHSDLSRLTKAAVAAELVERVTLEDHSTEELFLATTRAFAALNREDSSFFVGSFALRVLQIEGFAPQLNTCFSCGESSNLAYFNTISGDVACRAHPYGREVGEGALTAMRAVLSGQTMQVMRLENKDVASIIESSVLAFAQFTLGIELRSVKSLNL